MAALRPRELSVSLRDPVIMRSIMCAEGALCTLDCKQQIDGLICHLVWKETSFLGGEIHFSNPNEPINLRSPLGPPCQRVGWVGRRKKALDLPFLTHFFPHFLSPFLAHLFSTLADAHCASEASFSRLVSFSCSSITPPTLLSCGAFVIQRIEEEEEEERESEEENGFYCSALMVFCV